MIMTIYASFNQSLTELLLMVCPYVLLVLAALIFMVVRAAMAARILLACYSLGLVCIYLAGEPWKIPTKLWDQPFVVTWYYTAWLDLALAPCLAAWYWVRNHQRKRASSTAGTDPTNP